jgi:putative peptidoglycan lipid II flippase
MDAVDDSTALAAEPIPVPESPIEAGIGDETTTTYGVAGWTLFSRITGLLRVMAAGAILGSTFFANIFQATNSIPNSTFNLMAGSLLTSLIIPLVVAALDHEGLERARELVRHLVGYVIAGFLVAALFVVAFSPVIVHLLTLGVHGAAASAAARRECSVLLFLVIPQICCYGIVAVAVAAQNARGRFKLAAAAPAVENLGTILTLVLVSRIFGSDTADVSTAYLVFLGCGATLAVVSHAALQCWGAARVGLPLWPGWGWHDSAVRALGRRLAPAIGTATLDSSWLFILVVAAGVVPGGVVAVQVGINFYYLPVALSAKAVGTVLLPRMAREALQNRFDAFRATYDRGISWAWFVAVPTALMLVLLSRPIAASIAFGEMRENNGIALLSAAIASLGLALIGATMYEFGKQACYARHKVVPPLVACAVMVGLVLMGATFATHLPKGPSVLVALGLSVTTGELARSMITDRAARRGTHRQGAPRLRTLFRHVGAAIVTIGPTALLGRAVAGVVGGHLGAIVGVAAGAGAGLIAYVALQGALGAPELPPRLQLGSRRAAAAEVSQAEIRGPGPSSEGARSVGGPEVGAAS